MLNCNLLQGGFEEFQAMHDDGELGSAVSGEDSVYEDDTLSGDPHSLETLGFQHEGESDKDLWMPRQLQQDREAQPGEMVAVLSPVAATLSEQHVSAPQSSPLPPLPGTRDTQPTQQDDRFFRSGRTSAQSVHSCNDPNSAKPDCEDSESCHSNCWNDFKPGSAEWFADPGTSNPLANAAADPKVAMKVIMCAFHLIDKNGDGFISRTELIKALRKSVVVQLLLQLPDRIRQEDGTRDRFEEVFQEIDVDSSKELDIDEFQLYFKNRSWFDNQKGHMGDVLDIAEQAVADLEEQLAEAEHSAQAAQC